MKFSKYSFASLFLSIFFFTSNIKAQYTLSSSAIGGSGYTSITGLSGTTTVTTSGPDEDDWNVSIGFDFDFNGTIYNNLNIVSNGYLNFTNSGSDYIGKFTSLSTDDIIAPLWTDFDGGSQGTIQYLTSGNAPNRVFTVEWVGYGIYEGTGDMNFKVELFETSNNIKFSYGSLSGSIQSSSGYIASGLGFNDGTFLALTDLSTDPSLSNNTPMTIDNELDDGSFNQSVDVTYSTGYYYLFTQSGASPLLSITIPSANLTSCFGVASSAVSFGVTGSGLTASVTITVPSNFEISISPTGPYSTSLTLTYSATVSQTVYARLSSSASSGTSSGTITASSTSASNATSTITGTVHSNPDLSTNAITICKEGSFLITASTSAPVENGWTAMGSITVNKNGYITAGTVEGSYVVSYTNACFLTSSATITVVDASANIVADVTGGAPSYKFDGTAKGPVANIYVGYNGFTYSSESQPTGRGFYRANQVSGNSAGCPYSFYIFKCSNCPVAPPAPVLSIGDAFGGGIVAYILQPGDTDYDANTQHGLIAATSDQSTGIRWYNGTYTTTTATGTAIGTGLANTNAIIAAQGETKTSYAAGLARAYNGGGYSDWYLPSKEELNLMYINIGKGASSPNYNIGGFADNWYWSSTEADASYAWCQYFGTSFQTIKVKSDTYYVRAIRPF